MTDDSSARGSCSLLVEGPESAVMDKRLETSPAKFAIIPNTEARSLPLALPASPTSPSPSMSMLVARSN